MGSKNKTPAVQTVVNQTQLPEWVNTAAKDNLAEATKIANGLKGPYTGNLVADFNKDHTAMFNQVRNAATAAQPGLDQSASTLSRLQNYQNQNVGSRDINAMMINSNDIASRDIAGTNIGARSFLDADVSKYMDPYVNSVNQAAMDNIERQRQLSLNQTGDQAVSRGAFGGSRHAIQSALTNSEAQRNAGQITSQNYSNAFNTAMQNINADNNRYLTADQSNQANALEAARANQQAALSASQSNQNAALQAAINNQASQLTADRSNQSSSLDAAKANQAANLEAARLQALAATQGAQVAGQKQSTMLQGAAALEGIADKQRGLESEKLLQDAAQYEAARNFPLEKLNIKMGALGMTPYGQTSTQTGPSNRQSASPGMNALGGALTGAQLGSMLFPAAAGATGMTGGAMGVSGIGALLGLLSDEDTKVNKQKLGKVDGVDIYAYDYKADVEAAKKSGKPMGPKRVGPMAQDMPKGSTVQIGGKKVIKSDFLGPKPPKGRK